MRIPDSKSGDAGSSPASPAICVVVVLVIFKYLIGNIYLEGTPDDRVGIGVG